MQAVSVGPRAERVQHAQVDLVKTGKPFVMFGDGRLAACKPISEGDLAAFMADCVCQPDKVNQTLPIGGAQPQAALAKQSHRSDTACIRGLGRHPSWSLGLPEHPL